MLSLSLSRLLRCLAYAMVFSSTLAAVSASATTPYDADGNDAVRATLFAWALAENPELATSPQMQMAIRQIGGLPGPTERPNTVGAGPEVETYLREVGEAARASPAPKKIRIEIPASLQSPPPSFYGGGATNLDGLRLSSQTEHIEDTAALLRVYLQWPSIRNAMAEWVLDKPFYLPLPSDLAMPERERDNAVREKTLLSIVLSMSDLAANVRGSAPHLIFTGVSADARVESVELIRRIERRSKGVFEADPDQVLARWESADKASDEPGSPGPIGPREIVALFGGAIDADRYVPLNATAASLSSAIGGTTGRIKSSYGPTRAIETALAFSAILKAGGNRTIGADAAQTALTSIVGEREKYELFPVSYLKDYGGMNELQRSAAFAQAEPKLRALLAARAPQLPLKVRSVVPAVLGAYDMTLQGFPLRASAHELWLPQSQATAAERAELLPSFLSMPQGEAGELLAAVERSNERLLYIAVDYSLAEAVARPGQSGPIRPEELPLVRYKSQVEGVTVYADAELTSPVSVTEYERGTGSESEPLPNAIFATTGKSLMGALGRQPEGRAIVLQAVGSMRKVQQAPPAQRNRMAEIIADDVLAAALDEYWIGTRWYLGEFDEARGGFTVKSVSFQAVAHGEDISGISVPELAIDEPRDFEVLQVSPEQRAALEPYLDLTRAGSRDGMLLMSYARIQPMGAEQNRGAPVLKISAPSELLLGAVATGGRQWPTTDLERITITPPPEFGPSGGSMPEVNPPETLLLDHEGVDLLAVSLAPETYGPPEYERMLLERFFKERNFEQNLTETNATDSLAWGRFFENPAVPLTKGDMLKLGAMFREWTLARAAALPSTLTLPVGGQPHPLTQCRGLGILTQPHIDMNDPFLKRNTPALLGPAVVPNPRHYNFYGTDKPMAGPDTVLYWDGGGPYGGSHSCNYIKAGLRSMAPGMQPKDAAFSSAMIIVKNLPAVGPISEIPDSFLYRLSVDELRFVPAAELDSPPAHHAGFIVLNTSVEAAEAYRQDRFGGGYKTVGKIVEGDW